MTYADEVRHRREISFVLDPRHQIKGALARLLTTAVRHRHKRGLEGLEFAQSSLQHRALLIRFRRKELKRACEALSEKIVDAHRTSWLDRSRLRLARCRPRQSTYRVG